MPAIIPDQGLLVAVARFSGGDSVHILMQLRERYIWACERGYAEMAEQVAILIRTKLIEWAVQQARATMPKSA